MARRYRKGQTFRPPTAAESAAQADAIDAHRRKPARPQDRPSTGQHILVKTPEDGIQARDEETIYWAMCKRVIQRNTADEKEIADTDEEIIVFNTLSRAIAGDSYVMTGLTECGVRHVLSEAASGTEIIRFEVISLCPYVDDISTPCAAVNAEVLTISCSSGVSVGDEVIVYDPSGCWFQVPIEVLENAVGVAVSMQKGIYWDIPDCMEDIDSGDCWWMVVSLCCVEEIYWE